MCRGRVQHRGLALSRFHSDEIAVAAGLDTEHAEAGLGVSVVADAGREVVVDVAGVDARSASRCRSSDWEPSAFETRALPISMCRKRPFATYRQGRRPARAAVCRIPCRILCRADVERVCQCRAPHAPWECVELDPVGLLAGARSSLISTAAPFARPAVNRSTSTTLTFDAAYLRRRRERANRTNRAPRLTGDEVADTYSIRFSPGSRMGPGLCLLRPGRRAASKISIWVGVRIVATPSRKLACSASKRSRISRLN